MQYLRGDTPKLIRPSGRLARTDLYHIHCSHEPSVVSQHLRGLNVSYLLILLVTDLYYSSPLFSRFCILSVRQVAMLFFQTITEFVLAAALAVASVNAYEEHHMPNQIPLGALQYESSSCRPPRTSTVTETGTTTITVTSARCILC